MRKLSTFLLALAEVPAGERRSMVRVLESDPAYGRRVGEHLIELLDRLESHGKPAMVGAVFAAYASGRFNVTMLHRLINAIERLPTNETDNVRRFANSVGTGPKRVQVDDESMQALTNAGLTTVASAFGGLNFSANQTCSLFLELNLDVKSATS